MKRGDIVFVQSSGVIASISRFFDGKGKFSHVAVAISDSKVIEADVGLRVTANQFNKDSYSLVEVIDLGLTTSQRQDAYNSALKMIGTKYDYVQLIWYILRGAFKIKGRNMLNNPKYVICSELVFIVLNEVGILDELGISDSFENGIDLTPNELYDLVKFVSKI